MFRPLWYIAVVWGAWSFSASCGNAESHSWPQWQGPQRNALTDETGLLQAWDASGPKRVWLFNNCGLGYAGPAIVDGKLYILGARDGICQFLALDANTGDEIWTTSIDDEFQNDWGNGPRATPTVDGDFVYAMSGNGVLVCLRRSDGREVWRTTMESLGGAVPKWGYTESVLIDGDQLLCTPGGRQGTIAALDKRTGKVLWRSQELTDGAQYSSIMRADFHGTPTYVQLLETRLVGVAVDDGRLLWDIGWPGSVAVIPTPLIHDNKIFVTSGYGAGCMLVEINDQNQATDLYRNKEMKNHHGGVILYDDHVYGHSDRTGWMCLDFATGEPAWRERSALGKGAIGYADGRFYCIDEQDGDVVLIDASPAGWQERGRFTLVPQTKIRADRGGIWVHPVVVNGKLYLRDQDLLYCYDVKQ